MSLPALPGTVQWTLNWTQFRRESVPVEFVVWDVSLS